MAYTFIPNSVPSYMALSTDISGSKIDGVSYIGAVVYMTDTGKQYRVLPDQTLEEVPENVGGYAAPDSFVSGSTVTITSASSTEVVGAQGAGVSIYLTHILVTNADASVGTFVNITDGEDGAVKYSGYAASAGGGFSANLLTPLKFTANTGVYVKCETADAEVRMSASGYKA